MTRLMMFSVLAAFVVCVTSQGHGFGLDQPATFDCPEDGLFADYDRNCVVYYQCQNGEQTTFGCQQNTLFDEAQGRCRPKQYVTCKAP